MVNNNRIWTVQMHTAIQFVWCIIKEHSEGVYYCILCKITCHHHFHMPDQCCTWWVLQCSLNAEMVCAFTCNQSFFCDLITLILIFYMQMFGIILILGIGKLLKIVDIPDPSWGQIQKVKGWLTIYSSNTEQWLDCAWNTSMESYLREVTNGIPQGLSSVQVSLMPTLQSDIHWKNFVLR